MFDPELSKPHRKFLDMLEEAGFACSNEHSIPPYYSLDIYLKDYHVAVEIDGPHHSRPRDAKRDRIMLEVWGIPTFRVSIKSLTAEKVLEVYEFAESFLDSFTERKTLYRKSFSEFEYFS